MSHQRNFLILVIGIITVLACQQAQADFLFGTAENLGVHVNTEDYEWFPRLEADGLSLHFIRNLDEWENWLATRATKNGTWDTVVRVEGRPNWYASYKVVPGVTTIDGLEVYLWAALPEGHGGSDIYVKTRETIDSPWSTPIADIGTSVNTEYNELMPSISPNGLELYFSDFSDDQYDLLPPGGYGSGDLWVARRATRNDPWQEPENLGQQVNSPAADVRLHISADGLLLFFDSRRSGGQGGADLYMTRRKNLSDAWGEAVNLGPNVNSSESEYNPCISADGCTLIFVRNQDLWQASIEPVVDLNSDGIVDAADICIVVDNWGTDNSLCDVGPTPFGDGIVDVKDLIVLAEHLFEETAPIE